MANPAFTTFYESKVIASTTADAAATLVYTVPPHHETQVTMIMAANGGATITFNVEIFRASTSVYSFLVRGHSILTGLTYNALGSSRLFLHAGDQVLAFKSGGTLDISVSGQQFYNPSRST